MDFNIKTPLATTKTGTYVLVLPGNDKMLIGVNVGMSSYRPEIADLEPGLFPINPMDYADINDDLQMFFLTAMLVLGMEIPDGFPATRMTVLRPFSRE